MVGNLCLIVTKGPAFPAAYVVLELSLPPTHPRQYPTSQVIFYFLRLCALLAN